MKQLWEIDNQNTITESHMISFTYAHTVIINTHCFYFIIICH